MQLESDNNSLSPNGVSTKPPGVGAALSVGDGGPGLDGNGSLPRNSRSSLTGRKYGKRPPRFESRKALLTHRKRLRKELTAEAPIDDWSDSEDGVEDPIATSLPFDRRKTQTTGNPSNDNNDPMESDGSLDSMSSPANVIATVRKMADIDPNDTPKNQKEDV